MILPRLTLLSACATSLILLSSCQFGEKPDAYNPTVTEMDALDLQWGLPARKSKGGPRRTYQYMDSGRPAAGAPAQAPATPPTRETVNTPPPAAAAAPAAPAATAPAAAPAVPANLR